MTTLSLTSVRQYLSARRRATLRDISLHCQSSPDATRIALEHWIHKGRVRRLDDGETEGHRCSGSCCCSRVPEIYEWRTDWPHRPGEGSSDAASR